MAYGRTGWLGFLAAMVLVGGLFALGHAAEPAGGMVIHQDPVTGELTVPPPDVAPAVGERLLAPADTATEEPGTTPAGGWKLRVPRGFIHTMQATSGAGREVTTECVSGR
jgi:hypothetical protein